MTDEQKLKSPWGARSAKEVVITKDFFLAVKMGQIPGHSAVDKYGVNRTITTGSVPEDCWEGGGLYIYDPDETAPIVSLISDNVGDSGVALVDGLDVTGARVIQPVTVDGTNRVALTTPLWRAFRITPLFDLAGTLYVYTGTGGVPAAADIRALVDNGNNRTLMALFTIPDKMVGFLCRGEAGIEWDGGVFSGTEFLRGAYKSRRFGGPFAVAKEITATTSGDSIYQDRRTFPDTIPGKTDIRIEISEVSAIMGAWAAFDILLVEEGYLHPDLLNEIGQIGY